LKNELSHIEKVIAPFLESDGVELVELKAFGSGRSQTLKVIVWAKGGLDLNAITRIARHIGDILDAEDVIPGSYNLEVSSPGLDRKLKTGEDFRRAEGEKVRIVLEDDSKIIGTIISSKEGTVVIETEDGLEEVAVKKIVKGKIEIEF